MRVFMWFATVGFSLIGVVMLVVGPELETRLFGVVSLALFGVGGGVFLRANRRRGPIEPVLDVGRTELLGVSEPGVELVVKPPVNPVVSFVVVLVLAVGLIAIGASEGAIVALILGVVTFALFVYMAGAYVRRRGVRARVVLTATGFVFEHPVSSLGVRWGDVDGLTLFTQNHVLHLGVDAPKEAVIQRDGSTALTGMGRALSGTAIAVPALGLPADPEHLLAALGDYAGDPSPLRDPERERSRLAARLAGG